MIWVDVIGYTASFTVLATFCMTTMYHLRLLAIGSNILFICFGALAHIHPVLLLHIILLPINVARLIGQTERASDSARLRVARSPLLKRLKRWRARPGMYATSASPPRHALRPPSPNCTRTIDESIIRTAAS
jgi:hypothetical protein